MFLYIKGQDTIQTLIYYVNRNINAKNNYLLKKADNTNLTLKTSNFIYITKTNSTNRFIELQNHLFGHR